MKNRTLYLINLFLILVIVSMLGILTYKHNNRNISFYTIERTTNDLELTIENLNLLSLENGLYVNPGYSIRTNDYNTDKLENIIVKITIDNQPVLMEHIGSITPMRSFQDSSLFINKLKVNDDSKIIIDMNYCVNGEDRSCNTEFNLKNFESNVLVFNTGFDFYY